MKNLKILSAKANYLRQKFQKEIVNRYIKENGSLKGYRGQIYLMLPCYSKKEPLYKDIKREVYIELKNYLLYNQSQKKFNNSYSYINKLFYVKEFSYNNLKQAFKRVWHNGINSYGCEDNRVWASQAKAIYNLINYYDFTFYTNDYNFGNHMYEQMNKYADPLMVSIYEKKIHAIMSYVKEQAI